MQEILKAFSLVKTFPRKKKEARLGKNAQKTTIALNGLSFSVKEGEIYGLLGSNGAGKTTAMRTIAGLLKSDRGDVLVNGISVRDQTLEVRRVIGFLSEDLKLEEFFSPDYLFDFFSSIRGMPKNSTTKRKRQLFDYFGINHFAQERIATLSNGMKQKVSLALSIAHNPMVIIFDEPTNGLDIITSRLVVDFLLEMKRQGKTIIVSTHIFSLVEKICDRVGIIIDGQMVLTSPVSKIIEKTTLEDFFFSLYDKPQIYKDLELSH
jgi:sodium transport system ATP-binding protein